MSDTIIRVEGLGKHYRLGAGGDADSLREAVSMGARNMLRRMVGKGEAKSTIRDFWALRDVSFDVRQGDVVGIIGHNGAGKSTLLKILSRITDPTTGHAQIWGRLGSLLEVGTGFHPELSGRENIFLNGSILGMTTWEIKSKFDEIVAFSEIEEFLETPVKRYSSGMYVRLAFAVAAHLQPEILIVDEVLAVGDVKFQNKCMGKMKDVAGEGRTVLFVSHNMGAVQSMCNRGIVLDHGRVRTVGTAAEAVSDYLSLMSEKAQVELSQRTDRKGDGAIRVNSIGFTSNGDKPLNTVATGETVQVDVALTAVRPELSCILIFTDHHGQKVLGLRSLPAGTHDRIDTSIGNKITCIIEHFPLTSGQYHVQCQLWSRNNTLHDHIESALLLDVIGGEIQGRRVRSAIHGTPVVPPQQWISPA